MPTYCYQCQSCGHTFEVEHGINEEVQPHGYPPGHPATWCGGALKRLLFPVTGWIVGGPTC